MNDPLEWFRNRGQWLKIDRIAKEIKVPGRTLRSWIVGTRPLPNKWKEPLSKWVRSFVEGKQL
jgi:hypothetical protein